MARVMRRRAAAARREISAARAARAAASSRALTRFATGVVGRIMASASVRRREISGLWTRGLASDRMGGAGRAGATSRNCGEKRSDTRDSTLTSRLRTRYGTR